MRGKRRRVVLAAGLIGLAIPASASAATQIGQTFEPNAGQSGFTHLQTGSPGGQYAAPFAGVITSWSHRAHPSQLSVPELKFKVARPAGGNNYMIVGEEGPRTPTAGMLNTYPARISVEAGDVIGFYQEMGAATRSESGYATQSISGDAPPGSTATFGAPETPRQLDVSATLEPDSDCDGFGDETQDAAVTPPGDCPQAKADRTLTLDANKGKVKKGKRVTLTGQLNQVARQGACESGQPVQLQRKRPSQTTFTTVEQLQTDAAGRFSAKEKVKKTFEYRAQVAETAACAGGLSNTEKVKVRKKR
jgi:hypothetical protein